MDHTVIVSLSGVEGEPDQFVGNRLSGFAEWKYRDRKLVATNDRLGYFPLYYGVHKDKAVLSTSIAAILDAGIPKTLDDAALSIFVRIGYFFGEDTPFLNVRALPPSARLVWENGQVTISSNFPNFSVRDISRDKATDIYIQLFKQAIERRLPDGPTMLPLSGGRDSRHILFELCSQGHPPDVCATTLHFPPFNNEDASIAKMVTNAVGVKHCVLRHTEDYVGAEIKTIKHLNYCADDHQWVWKLIEFAGDRFQYSYDGIAGDIMSAATFQKPEQYEKIKRGDISSLAKELLLQFGRLNLLKPGAQKRFNDDLAYQRFETEIRKHLNQPNPMASFFLFNRTRREIALGPLRIFGRMTAHCPFLDSDIVDFLMTLHYDMIVDHRFHDLAINRAFPQYAHIPFEDKSAVPQSGALFYFKNALSSLRLLGNPSMMDRFAVLLRIIRHCVDDEIYGLVNSVAYASALAQIADNDFRD